MSRSRTKRINYRTRKHAAYTQTKWMRLSRRRLRSRNRQRVRMGEEPFLVREIINPWDSPADGMNSTDFFFRGDDPKLLRK